MPDPTPMPADFPAQECEGEDVDVGGDDDVDDEIEKETGVESKLKIDCESAL